MTPLNPMFPNDRGASGAGATDMAAAAVGAATLSAVVRGAADAGKAREATMAPEMRITAEAFEAGLAERKIADDREDEGLS